MRIELVGAHQSILMILFLDFDFCPIVSKCFLHLNTWSSMTPKLKLFRMRVVFEALITKHHIELSINVFGFEILLDEMEYCYLGFVKLSRHA